MAGPWGSDGKQVDEFLQRSPTSTLSTCPFINPAGQPFVCANIRLAVCLSVRSAVEVFPFFFFFPSSASRKPQHLVTQSIGISI